MTLLLAFAIAFAIFTLVSAASQAQRAADISGYETGADFSGDIANSTTHFGLRSLRERVRRLHGTFASGPGPDGGFLVRARIPLQAGGIV